MKIFFTLLLLGVLGTIYFFYQKEEVHSGHIPGGENHYIYMGRCSLWDNDVNVIFHFPGSYCEIVPNVGVAIRTENGLSFVNERNELIFKKDEIYHHGVYLDRLNKLLFVLTATDHQENGGEFGVLSGVKAFDFEGNEKISLDGMDIVSFLRGLGVKVELHDRSLPSAVKIGLQWMSDARLKSRKYLTLFNNLFVLEKSIPNTVYKKGDYLINLLYPTGFVLIDRETSKPKKWFPYYARELSGMESHHPMIIGNDLVIFLNRVDERNGQTSHARIASYNLLTEKLNWSWPEETDALKIYSPSHGGIFSINPDNFLIYTMYDKFIMTFNARSREHHYILKPDSDKLEGIGKGGELVDLKLVKLSSIENFKFLNLDLYFDNLVTLDPLISPKPVETKDKDQ